MALINGLIEKMKKQVKDYLFTESEFERFKRTKTFNLINFYKYDRFISHDLEKDEYSKLKIKKMHYKLDQKGLLTNEIKEQLLTKTFEKQVGYTLNLKEPKSFNEKIMWMKLYYQNSLITKCADKFAMKEYVSNIIGDEYVVPVINSWVNVDHIDFNALPEQYVIKVNWATGYLKIIKDKTSIDIEQLKKQLKQWMKPYRNSYYQAFNWGFKNMPPIVFAEQYMEQPEGELYDYKFFCFDGKVELMFIATDRFNEDAATSHDFFDRDFNPLDITLGTRSHVMEKIKKPDNFDLMKELAEKLAKPFPFVRVDFYEVDGKVYVGEMTFYPGGALLPFFPTEWDWKLGEKLVLPEKVIQDRELYYEPLTAKECYLLENKITYHEKKQYCIQKSYAQMGYLPNLENPKSLNEKIIWLALNYKNPEIKVAADKETAKKYIADKIGVQYVVPLIGAYSDVDDIKIDDLPNKFVCKANDGWGSEQVIIVKNKNTCDFEYLKVQMSNWLYPWSNYYYKNMCITDKKIDSKIVIEELLEDSNGTLDDYKIYCCNGEPKFALVVSDRNEAMQTRTFVDINWNPLPVRRKGKSTATKVKKPNNYDKMIEVCKILSEGFPLVRVDFYEVDNMIFVGEMTFTPGMFLGLRPIEMDYKLGEYLDLSNININDYK